ncbi:MAG TPA: hypothetical protein VM100_03180 [Longimicrobiales bacterium]|nr:hypothetical protein [Longimicrobiales bacterium]
MQELRNRKRFDPGNDGIRVVEKPGRRMKWAAGAVVVALFGAAAMGVLTRDGAAPDVREASAPDAAVSRAGVRQAVATVRSRSARNAHPSAAATGNQAATSVDEAQLAVVTQQAESALADAKRDLAFATPEQAKELEKTFAARAEELLEAARDAGANTGLAAFPAPGTSPIKTGLVVPRSFELPEGYIRHTQITDDGRRLEPVLMFSPDYEFFDASGNPIKIPDNGIVPTEMAPAGLPLHTLAMPKHPYGASLQ